MATNSPVPLSQHGSLASDGFRVQSFEFHSAKDFDLPSSGGIKLPTLVINLGTAQQITWQGSVLGLDTGHIAILCAHPQLRWVARAACRNRFLVVELGEIIMHRLSALQVRWRVELMGIAEGGTCAPLLFPASSTVLTLASHLAAPPAHAACLPVWYQAKVMELASLTLFRVEQPEPTDPAFELNRSRIERALMLLERDMGNPPTLEMLADEVGCSAFHLSRLFATHVGRTMPEFLRQRRIERAALLLKTTRQSVSDIALEVGYESFSAFSRGFTKEMGTSPRAYRDAENQRENATAGKSKARRGKQRDQTS